jgi:Uma2 family endonuclease
MSVITATGTPVLIGAPAPTAAPSDGLWRLSVDQYHQMIDAGILVEDDPVEFLEGLLVEKMVKKPPHVLAANLVRTTLERLAPGGWFLNAQDPITTAESEPEPDLAVVRGDRRQYASHHPGPEDLALVVEVSDSTLQRDRTLKLRIYARAAIAIYWIVNLIEGHIEVYTDPTGSADEPSYRERRDYGPTDELPFLIEGREIARIAVRDLLP